MAYLPNNDVAVLFDIDLNCSYNDGDIVGICEDGKIRPFNFESEIKPVEYIGVLSLNPQILLGCWGTSEENKLPVIIAGRKSCWVNGTKLSPGKKIVMDRNIGSFREYDSLFDREYNGIIISVEEENRDKSLCYILFK